MSDLVQFKELRQKGIDEFHTSNDMVYNIISKKWLEEWLESKEKDHPIDNYSCVNSDLLQSKSSTIFKYDPIQSHMWNKIMLPNLQEGVDYEILDKASWEFIAKKYHTTAIERDATIVNGKKQVNVNLVPLNFGAVFPSSLRKYNGGKTASLIKGDQYVSRTCKLQSFIELLASTLQTVSGYEFLRRDGIRLYKAPIGMTISEIEKHISEEIKNLGTYDDVVFDFKDGDYLDPTKYETIDDCQIAPGQVILGDFKEVQKNWVIKHPFFPMEGKCEGCYNFKVLQFPCECKKVSYCTEECKKKDEAYHLPRCEKTDSDDETMDKLQRIEKSMDGKVGLQNLGNTCFMNSGIQCIGNTFPIREYLLSNQYKQDINELNTLGTKGELAQKFAHLLRRMWYAERTPIPPFSLKRAIGKFQPQFQGFQQHDSQELITYLLDGLNEDLCRIKQKPYVERKDYDGRPDFEVAKESWEQFKLRNDSIIVDNLYGQYKSTLRCPNCNKISITFDPYLMVNVSIPQNTTKKLEIQFIDPNLLWDCQTLIYNYEKTQDPTLGQILQSPEIQDKIQQINPTDLIYICTSAYQHDDTDENDKMSSLRKKLKYKKLYIRKALQSELNIEKDNKICIMIHESFKQNAQYQWKREITPAFNFYFDKTKTTHADIHKFIFDIHVGVLATFEDLPKYQGNNWSEYYEENILDKVYYLEFKSNQNWQVECAYCNAKSCNDCVCAYVQDTCIEKYIQKEPKLEIEVFVVWKRGFKSASSVDELYNDWLKHHQRKQTDVEELPKQLTDQEQTQEVVDDAKQQENISDEQSAQKQNFTTCLVPIEPAIPTIQPTNVQGATEKSMKLTECLKFSEQPEQLDEENTWYCNQCKDHVRAFKVMEIYKTPKILIFHLKRFKNSNKFFKSKLETLIDFPIENFDIREFVQNHHLPSDFANENPQNSKINDPYLL
ncbi:unnamed protein product (macronuclear) [Paramecium tetraurelia]|uniref:ubiquitinyl hydrolase 1 n=1 Tax=Paramecium tetraurelia TaxID=5888 RepID=A0CFU2_PARTE|nr:uncharacterized protein GSPATT00038101001 [Paramecium tetraurelia]CAK69659.1 unnamed protein product [Paramecium tetraurelia]|eukprot:XP_001437056.1 hypothetical protein (macronuclear) [Paramecium tetraurelia strain d4-2]